MGTPRPLHKQFFSTNRRLWLSIIPENDRAEFVGAERALPPNMVSSSYFARTFWNDPMVNLNSKMKSLTPDRAWFGIRSLIKGNIISEDVKKNGLHKDHFRQLVQNSDSVRPQLSARNTEKYFSNEDLILLIEIYNKYDEWITDKDYYDEMDIVRTAHRHLNTPEEKPFTQLTRQQMDLIIYNMDMTVESVEFKQEAIEKIESRKMNKEMFSRLTNFISRWCNEKIARGYDLHITDSGVHLYKMRLDDATRMIFSTTTVDNKNIELKQNGEKEYQPILFIYDIEFNHDNQHAWLERNIKNLPNPQNYPEDKEVRAEITHVKKMSETPGKGPTKTLPDLLPENPVDLSDEQKLRGVYEVFEDVNMPYNISLDYHQKAAIIEHQPLLIDGLAGTGKTAVLARRGVFRSGWAESDTRILYLASTDAVVQRLIDDTTAQLRRTDYWKEIHKRDFLPEFYGIHNEYNGTDTDLSIIGFGRKSQEGFDEIILDECQDITPLEFECLQSLVYSEDSRRLTFAGDPLQTLNPTGFDWDRIKAMFTHSMFETEEERNKNADTITITKFHQNYRSQENIVEFANAVQLHRAKLLGTDDGKITMEAMLDPLNQPYLVQVHDEEDKEVLKQAVSKSGVHNVITICWAADDNQIIDLCNGENSDETLKAIWGDVMETNEDSYTFRESVILHSSTSIKGDEFPSVMLYKFGSSHKGLLDSLTTSHDKLEKVHKDHLISISFAYSRLYVAITRPFTNIYIVEDSDGIGFWKNALLCDADGKRLDLWNSPDNIHSAKDILSANDFLINKQLTKNNFERYKKRWNESGNIIDLESAIRIAKELDNQEGLYELQGDLEKYKAELPGNQHNQQSHYEEAIKSYRAAKRPRKYLTILYLLNQWDKIETELWKSKKSFDKIMTLYCQLNQDKIKPSSIPDIRDILDNIIVMKCDWEDWNGSTIEDFKQSFKHIYLSKFVLNTNLLAHILDETVIAEFGFENIRKELEIWVDDYPHIYLQLVEGFAPKNYQTNTDKNYGRALMSRYQNLRDTENKRLWIKENIIKVDADNQTILKDFQAENLHQLIENLPKNKNDYQLEINGFPSFSYRFNNTKETDKLNKTQKLICYLRESLELSDDGDDFSSKYGGGLYKLLQLDLDKKYVWRGKLSDIIDCFYYIICDDRIRLSTIEQTSWLDLEAIAGVFSKLIHGDYLNESMIKDDSQNITTDLKEIIFGLQEIEDYGIIDKFLKIVLELKNKKNNLNKAWLDVFDAKNVLDTGDPSWDQLLPPTHTIIEKYHKSLIDCVDQKVGEESWKNIVKIFHLFTEFHFHQKTTDLDAEIIDLLVNNEKHWSERHRKLIKIIQFHQTKEGQSLLASIDKERKIDSSKLQPYIDMLNDAGENGLRYEKLMKIDLKDFRSQLDVTKSYIEWMDVYFQYLPKLDKNKKFIGIDDIISILSKDECVELPNIDTNLRSIWTSVIKESNEMEELVKIVNQLPLKYVLNIFRICRKSISYIALLSHKEFNKIQTSFNHLFLGDIITLVGAENNLLMKQTLPPANETVKQREKRIASSKHKKLLQKTAGVNALYMKLNSMSDVLPYCVAFVLANEKTDSLTGYKNSLEISSGTGSKAKHIRAILKHFNIEIDEVVEEIVDLF